MTRKNLIIIHRGKEYETDFLEIAAKVFALDENITTFCLDCRARQQIPEPEWRYPTLVVSLNSVYNLQVKRGHVLKNHAIDKLEQARRAQAGGATAPPLARFVFGMNLDPIAFGTHVILKPMSINSSGDGVHLFRRARAEMLRPGDFPPHHPIHHDPDGYLVQRFIDTGIHPGWNRVLTFLGEPIYETYGQLLTERPPLDAPDDVLANAIVAIQGSVRQRNWRVQEDVLAEARKIGAAFHDAPLLAVDFMRDQKTGRLYFLECNPGGNTWHFSSDQGGGINLRMELGQAHIHGEARAHVLGRKRMIEQFGAWDICARALVRKVHELAC